MSLNHISVSPGFAHRAAALLTVAMAVTALAGEKMVESAPSKERPKLPNKVTPIDPILDRVLNPGGANNSGLNPGGMPTMPVVPQTRPGLDPNLQRQLGLQLDKRRNWLLENAARVDSSGLIKDAGLDSPPRFSQPNAVLSAPGTGERYLRATERTPSGQPAKGTDPTQPTLAGDPDSPSDNTASSQDSARAIPFRTMTGEGTASRNPDASQAERKGLFTDPGAFANSSRSALDEARKTAAEERSAIFDRLLSNNSQSSSPSGDSSPLGSLGLQKTPPSRSQQFQSLLAGPSTASPSVGLFGSPLNNAEAPRPAANAFAERPAAAASPIAPPAAPKPAPVRIEPRPALLQIPTRGF